MINFVKSSIIISLIIANFLPNQLVLVSAQENSQKTYTKEELSEKIKKYIEELGGKYNSKGMKIQAGDIDNLEEGIKELDKKTRGILISLFAPDVKARLKSLRSELNEFKKALENELKLLKNLQTNINKLSEKDIKKKLDEIAKSITQIRDKYIKRTIEALEFLLKSPDVQKDADNVLSIKTKIANLKKKEADITVKIADIQKVISGRIITAQEKARLMEQENKIKELERRNQELQEQRRKLQQELDYYQRLNDQSQSFLWELLIPVAWAQTDFSQKELDELEKELKAQNEKLEKEIEELRKNINAEKEKSKKKFDTVPVAPAKPLPVVVYFGNSPKKMGFDTVQRKKLEDLQKNNLINAYFVYIDICKKERETKNGQVVYYCYDEDGKKIDFPMTFSFINSKEPIAIIYKDGKPLTVKELEEFFKKVRLPSIPSPRQQLEQIIRQSNFSEEQLRRNYPKINKIEDLFKPDNKRILDDLIRQLPDGPTAKRARDLFDKMYPDAKLSPQPCF